MYVCIAVCAAQGVAVQAARRRERSAVVISGGRGGAVVRGSVGAPASHLHVCMEEAKKSRGGKTPRRRRGSGEDPRASSNRRGRSGLVYRAHENCSLYVGKGGEGRP